MILGVLAGLATAVWSILMASYGQFSQSPDAYRNLWIAAGLTLVLAAVLGVAGLVSSFFPRLVGGFCTVFAPGALATAVICLFTDQAKYAAPYAVWMVTSLASLWICGNIVGPIKARRAYENGMEALKVEAARAERREAEATSRQRSGSGQRTTSPTGPQRGHSLKSPGLPSGAKDVSSAVQALLASFRNPDHDEPLWQSAVGSLGRIGTPAVEPLLVALKDEDAYVRQGAAEALGQIGDATTSEPLVGALRDEEWTVRLAAGLALGQIGDIRAVEPLIVLLAEDEEDLVRSTAAEALGEIGDKRAVEPLLGALTNDEEGNVRSTAAEALGEIGDTRAEERLRVTAHTDKQEFVRQAALRALGQIGSA